MSFSYSCCNHNHIKSLGFILNQSVSTSNILSDWIWFYY